MGISIIGEIKGLAKGRDVKLKIESIPIFTIHVMHTCIIKVIILGEWRV